MNKNQIEAERVRLNSLASQEVEKADELAKSSPSLSKSVRAVIDTHLAKAKQYRHEAAQLFGVDDAYARLNAARADMGMSELEAPSAEDPALRSHKEQRDALYAYMKHGEIRTYAGMNTTVGSNGGFLIPADFQRELFKGIAQYSDLMNENNVRLLRTEKSNSITLPGVDLSEITASLAAQASDVTPGTVFTVSKNVLGGYTYRTSPIAATIEIEQDSFEDVMGILTQAFAVGIARGVGGDLVNGSGSGAPQGLLTAAANSNVTTALNTAITSDEINSIFFSLNRAYRASAKCAWVMADATYELIRKAKDSNDRPLLSMENDKEVLMGKRVLIAPDMPTGAGSKAIVFGDLSQFVVRVASNSIAVRRSFESAGMAEIGAALYTTYLRVDAELIAPGSVQPVVYATLHS